MQQMNEVKNIFAQVAMEVGNTTSVQYYEKLAQALSAQYPEQAQKAADKAMEVKKAEFAMKPEEGKAPTTRKYEKGNEVIYEQWNPAKKEWVEYGKAPRSVGGQAPDAIQNLQFQAKRLNCNLNDPECYKQAEAAVLNLKRADVPGGQIVVKTVENLNEELGNTRKLASRVNKIDKAFKILKGADGQPITGSFADARTGAAKLGELFGISSNKAVQASEALKSNNMALAGELLASGMFGAGTGISDRDMETALQMAGADMALSFDGMVRILENLREEAVNKIGAYNNDVDAVDEAIVKKSGYSRNRYKVPVPPPINKPESKTPSVSTTPFSDAEKERRYQEFKRQQQGG
jgi:hypothetical protein